MSGKIFLQVDYEDLAPKGEIIPQIPSCSQFTEGMGYIGFCERASIPESESDLSPLFLLCLKINPLAPARILFFLGINIMTNGFSIISSLTSSPDAAGKPSRESHRFASQKEAEEAILAICNKRAQVGQGQIGFYILQAVAYVGPSVPFLEMKKLEIPHENVE